MCTRKVVVSTPNRRGTVIWQFKAAQAGGTRGLELPKQQLKVPLGLPEVTVPGGASCENPDLCSAEYTDCSGNTHLYNYNSYSNPKGSRDSDRIQNIESCGTNTYNSVSGQLTWMQTVLSTWQNNLSGMATEVATVDQPCAICQDALSAITVDQVTHATDSTSTISSQPRDGTSWLAAACNGAQTCDYQLKREDFDFSGNFALFEVMYRCGADPTERTLMLTGAGNPQLAEDAYVHLDCSPQIKNLQASFRGQPVAVGMADADVSSFSASPDASKLIDGIFAPNGDAYDDPQYAIVFARTGTGAALVADLGRVYPLKYAEIQADHNDVYHVDYSTDRVTWAPWVDFPTVSAGGLQTRSSPNNLISARYLRVYPTSGDGKYSISELRPYNPNGLSYAGQGTGPEPLITNGEYAPEGTAYNDANYATVLAGTGSGNALRIDLKTLHGGLDRVKIQANDPGYYGIDVSADGTSWFNWHAFAPVSSSGGLRTRDSGPLPPIAARYVRVYAISGAGPVSVSEVPGLRRPGHSILRGRAHLQLVRRRAVGEPRRRPTLPAGPAGLRRQLDVRQRHHAAHGACATVEWLSVS